MKKSFIALILSLALIAVGAQAAQSEDTPLPKPDVLTEEDVFTSQKLSVYDTIIIRDFTTDGAEYSRSMKRRR